ncbi:unnamed protein product [Schistosoma mattheei]|uniref:Delta-like protein n=1 Tax=Schistosoma mattheei TaxID=31246 RepID=A0AA85B6E7_9TREM|nr:unnamed protein product [Schistosoma mattheei]
MIITIMESNLFQHRQQRKQNGHIILIISSLFYCFFCVMTHDNEFRESRKFFTRSVFDLRIEHLILNLANHLNKSNELIYKEKCFTHININQCHFVLGICIAETKYINNVNQRILLNRPILIKRQDKLIHPYNRTSSFSWEFYNDLLPVDCEIGHGQILTGLLNLNTSINHVNLTYSVKLSTMIKHNVKLLFNVYHLTSNGDLWLIDQLSSILSRVELNQPWRPIKLLETRYNSSTEIRKAFRNENSINSSSSSLILSQTYFNISASYRYSCTLNYYGEHCNHYCKPRDSKLGHYQCHPQTGELICNAGWTGARCNQALCRKGCKHGTCIGPELCRCIDGWAGLNCDQCITTPGCLNGHCQFNSKHTSYLPFTCECEPGWTGMLCNINMRVCDSNEHVNICQNHGICINQPDPNGLKVLYRCECLPGFYGTHCEKQINNCRFHGCNNRGKCKKEGNCICDPSYYGSFCQFNQTTCSQDPCLGNLSKCYITPNETRIINNERSNQIVKQFKCQCEQGKFGENCEYDLDECLLEPCLNGGQCVDLITGYQCICPPRFTGPQCQFTLKACQNNSCSNGGECLDESVSFQCHCLKGWKGRTCRENINECSEIPKQTGRSLCQNNAGCRDLLGSYKCLCSSGWEGKHCEMRKSNKTQNNYHYPYHYSTDDCQYDKDVNNSISENRLNHHNNEFLILFIILTIAFLIMILSLSGVILFFCTSDKHKKMKKSKNISTCQMINTNLSKTINHSNSIKTIKSNYHHSTLSNQQFVYPIQYKKPITDWPYFLYVNKSISDPIYMNIEKNSHEIDQNQINFSFIKSPQCYIKRNLHFNQNTQLNSLLKSNNIDKYCLKKQLNLVLKEDPDKHNSNDNNHNNNNNNQYYVDNYDTHNHDNLNHSLPLSLTTFNQRSDTPPPTYEISIGLNKIVKK